MLPAHSQSFRLLAISLALAAVVGCPGPSQVDEEEIRPVRVTGSKKSPSPGTTATARPGASATPSAAATTGATASPSTGGTASPSPNGTTSPNPNATASPNPNGSASPSPSPSASASASPSPSPSASATASPSASPTASPSPSPTASPTAAPTATPTSNGGTPEPTRENGGSASTFAGNKDGQGMQDGTGTEATFQLPAAVTADAAGNVYVADAGNNAIRKITSGGVVSLLAGGSQGTNEGVGLTAQFSAPNGIAVDDAGVVYVADTNNNRVRKIVNGQTSLFIGAGSGGQTLAAPYGVAVDRQGNLFIADTNNRRILKVPAGQTTAAVFAGSGTSGSADGSGASAQFTVPVSLATDYFGNVYVADIFSLRKIDPSGVVTTPQVSGAQLFSQLRIATARMGDGSVIYASDTETDQVYILRRDADGNYDSTSLAGSTAGHTDAAGNGAQFNDPLQLWVTGSGTLFVPDYLNNVIRRLN